MIIMLVWYPFLVYSLLFPAPAGMNRGWGNIVQHELKCLRAPLTWLSHETDGTKATVAIDHELSSRLQISPAG